MQGLHKEVPFIGNTICFLAGLGVKLKSSAHCDDNHICTNLLDQKPIISLRNRYGDGRSIQMLLPLVTKPRIALKMDKRIPHVNF